MYILILNWRDIRNPAAGGAELLTHELSKGWVKAGHRITVLSSRFLGARKTESIDDVEFIRMGRWWSVHIHAFFYYLKNRDKFDLIIDEVHWFPFFARVYARNKTIALTCEVADKLFFKLFPYPAALFFRLIEKIYLYLYRNIPTMTISESTKKDLVKEGIRKDKITVLPMGLNIPKGLKKYPKEKNPTFIYLARLNKQKGIFDAIEAFEIISNQRSINKDQKSLKSHTSYVISHPILWVVGSGEDSVVNEAKRLVKEYGIQNSVKLFGFVTDTKKFELLARAHILLVPSAHEGWGLTVPEAASAGTPAIVYNVAGLSDIVKSGETGIIVKKNTPEELAKEAVKLYNNKSLYKKLQENGIRKVKDMKWSKTGKQALKFINEYLQAK
jgi:glycosyltransferase involved in cell wall biosynthesis